MRKCRHCGSDNDPNNGACWHCKSDIASSTAQTVGVLFLLIPLLFIILAVATGGFR